MVTEHSATLDQYDAVLTRAGLTLRQVTPTARAFSVTEASIHGA